MYSLKYETSSTDNSVKLLVSTPIKITETGGIINANDVLGSIHIYNAAAKGLSANRYWQSEVTFKSGQVTTLLIAEYSAWVDRLILPASYLELPSITQIKLTPI